MTVIVFFQTFFVLNKRRQINPTDTKFSSFAWWPSTDSSGRRGTAPPTEPGFSKGFFSILSPMEFSFLAAVASGLLSWGHLISSTIIDLIAQILFKTELSWTMPLLNSIMKCIQLIIELLNPVILHYWQNLPILILCSALLQFVLLKALYNKGDLTWLDQNFYLEDNFFLLLH